MDLGDFVGVGGDDFIDEAVDGSGVGGFEAHFLGQGSRVFIGSFPEGGEELAGLAVGDGAGFDEVENVGELRRAYGGVLDFDGLFVEESQEVVDDPVGNLFARSLGGFDGGFPCTLLSSSRWISSADSLLQSPSGMVRMSSTLRR